MDSNLYITPAKQFGQTLEASAQIEDKRPGIVLLEVADEKIQQKRFPGARAAENHGVRDVAVMEVQKVRRVVVRFQDREILLLEMAVLRLAAVEGKEKGIVRVVRVQEIEGAEIPGVIAGNLRSLYLLNSNYADYSFLFTLDCGEPQNGHLEKEYLAVLETNHHTPYFLNLHHRDVAHTMVLGRTGAGKSFLLNFLVSNLQKYDPWTFIFDLGGSFESLTELFGGSYIKVGIHSPDLKINPFSLPPTKENLDFLALFLKVLLQGQAPPELNPSEERDLYQQIENLYSVDPALRTLGVLANTLPRRLSDRLAKWTDRKSTRLNSSHEWISYAV